MNTTCIISSLCLVGSCDKWISFWKHEFLLSSTTTLSWIIFSIIKTARQVIFCCIFNLCLQLYYLVGQSVHLDSSISTHHGYSSSIAKLGHVAQQLGDVPHQCSVPVNCWYHSQLQIACKKCPEQCSIAICMYRTMRSHELPWPHYMCACHP